MTIMMGRIMVKKKTVVVTAGVSFVLVAVADISSSFLTVLHVRNLGTF